MSERPLKPFALATNPIQELENIRDKENAASELHAPTIVRLSRPNLAQPGMSGIKPHLPRKSAEGKLPNHGSLTKTFMPLAHLLKTKITT